MTEEIFNKYDVVCVDPIFCNFGRWYYGDDLRRLFLNIVMTNPKNYLIKDMLWYWGSMKRNFTKPQRPIKDNALFINECGIELLVYKIVNKFGRQKIFKRAHEFLKHIGIKVGEYCFSLTKEQYITSFIIQDEFPGRFEYQYRIGKYTVDMYSPSDKLIVEIDENGHRYYDNNKEDERTKYINTTLGITDKHWIRFNCDESSTFFLLKRIRNWNP